MPKSADTSAAVTLDPGVPVVTLSGSIAGYTPAGTYNGAAAAAAVFGPASASFILTNNADISATAPGQAADFGILLASSGTVLNAGTISGEGGIAIEGTPTPGSAYQQTSYILNTGLISASSHAGLVFSSYGYAKNAATGVVISTGGDGVVLNGGGYATNLGAITAGVSGIIAKGGNIENSGLIAAGGTGIDGTDGASIYNAGGGTITGGDAAVSGEVAKVTLTNAGLITAAGTGVTLAAGGNIANAGTIAGQAGIAIDGTITQLYQYFDLGTSFFRPLASVLNSGSVIGSTSDAIDIQPHGFVSNTSAGLIQGAQDGILLAGGGGVRNSGLIQANQTAVSLGSGGFAFNYGTITGAAGIAVSGTAGAYLFNAFVYNFSRIEATTAGIVLNDGGLANNYGVISAATGILLQAGGEVFNVGTIAGGAYGVKVGGGGTVVDDGAISAATAIYFSASPSNLLILGPSATTTGAVNGGGGTLELSNLYQYDAIGTLSTSQFSNFSALTIDQGATWEINGTITTAPAMTMVNDGVMLQTAADRMTIGGNLSGTGSIDLSRQVLTLTGAVAAGQTIAFTGTGETLALGDAKAFMGELKHFGTGDSIDLSGISRSHITGTHFAGGILTLDEGGGEITLTFTNAAKLSGDIFLLTAAKGGTILTLENSKPSLLAPPAPAAAGLTLAPPNPAHAAPLADASHLASSSIATQSWIVTTSFAHKLELPAVTLQS